MAIAVADIVANESIRYLVDEEVPHFATEFQSVLKDLDVLLTIEEVVIGTEITHCELREATCADYCVLDREVQIKSVAFELSNLPGEIKERLNNPPF